MKKTTVKLNKLADRVFTFVCLCDRFEISPPRGFNYSVVGAIGV